MFIRQLNGNSAILNMCVFYSNILEVTYFFEYGPGTSDFYKCCVIGTLMIEHLGVLCFKTLERL
jgi:hypothetical protein